MQNFFKSVVATAESYRGLTNSLTGYQFVFLALVTICSTVGVAVIYSNSP